MEGFTAHQACKFTGCSPRQLRYWDEIGLVRPSVQGTGGRPGVPRLYSFRDLVALRVVKSLLDGGMSLQRVRRSWEFLTKKAGLTKHLSEVKLVTDGQSIFKICRRDGEVIDALREGQMAFFVAIDDIATGVETKVREFEDDRERFVRALRAAAAQTATHGRSAAN
jgi:DNA-binding transcriptional MerR regulator